MGKRYRGGCLCGNIRFEAMGPAANPHTCSCRMCQRHTGALTVAWAEFSAEKVTWTGRGGTPSIWRSSDASSRAFCSDCGSTVGAIDDEPIVALVLGTFDAATGKELIPTVHAFRSDRPRWWQVATTADRR